MFKVLRAGVEPASQMAPELRTGVSTIPPPKQGSVLRAGLEPARPLRTPGSEPGVSAIPPPEQSDARKPSRHQGRKLMSGRHTDVSHPTGRRLLVEDFTASKCVRQPKMAWRPLYYRGKRSQTNVTNIRDYALPDTERARCRCRKPPAAWEGVSLSNSHCRPGS